MRATHLVGRERDLAMLDGAVRAALSGSGRVVLVRGEPGIGKTSLARVACDGAAALGLRVAWGRAWEQDGAPPFWPWRQAVGVDSEAFAVPDRFLAFEAVAHRLVADAEQTGAFVVLDDLHWADPGTVALFVHVAQVIENSRLVLVGTYRDTERTDLVRTLSGLASHAWVSHIRLAGLSDDDVARQLAEVTGTSVDEATVRRVVRRTRGNPFFVAQLGRALTENDHEPLPEAVRAAIERRLTTLPDTAQRVVAAAAVLGDARDPGALAAVAELSLDAVLDGTDVALAAGVLDEDRVIVHDLIAETARARIRSRELLGLHANAAAHLATRADAEQRVGEIAHHLLTALPLGDAAAAVAWAERAAARAREQLAWEQAAALLRRAVEAAGDRAERGRLLLAQARAELQGYDVGTALDTLREAAAIARTSPDPTALAEVALVLEGFGDMDKQGEIRALCTEALTALPESDVVRRARLLAQLAVHVQLVDASEQAEDLSGQALAAAERLGDPRTLVSALHARQLARSGPDGVHERLGLGDRLLGLGVTLDDPTESMWGHLWRFDALLQLGRLDAAEAEIGPMSSIADRTRLPLARWHVLRSRGAIAFGRGRFAEAEAVADEVAELSRRAGHVGGRMASELVTILVR
ncbi:MAG TPA: AAA family ATPase, partial [Pseudonocardiaceae bacterium]